MSNVKYAKKKKEGGKQWKIFLQQETRNEEEIHYLCSVITESQTVFMFQLQDLIPKYILSSVDAYTNWIYEFYVPDFTVLH